MRSYGNLNPNALVGGSGPVILVDRMLADKTSSAFPQIILSMEGKQSFWISVGADRVACKKEMLECIRGLGSNVE